jgi:SAM-dependent methyltransferase
MAHDHYHEADDAHAHAHQHAADAIKATHGADFTEQNRNHWDQVAHSYTSQPWQQDMMKRLTVFLRSVTPWLMVPFNPISSSPSSESFGPPATISSSSRPIRVLDYACGPGTVTDILGARANEYRGIDLSAQMVAVYNERFASRPEDGFTAHAVQGNLLAPNGDHSAFDGPEYHDFDLVAVGLGFHHFEDLPRATATLVKRMRPGGVFMIVDLVSHHLEEEYKHVVAHAGFGIEQVKQLFGEAGLVDVDWRVMEGEVKIKEKHPRQIFVARGRLPEGSEAKAEL